MSSDWAKKFRLRNSHETCKDSSAFVSIGPRTVQVITFFGTRRSVVFHLLTVLLNNMGAWGVASDQNDGVWDSVGCTIDQRMQGLSPLDVNDHDGLMSNVRQENPRGLSAGTVVWLLKMGCGLTKEELQHGLNELNAEFSSDQHMFPDNVEERNTVLRDEIDMISSAKKSDKGYAPDKYLVGVLGIFQVRMRKADGTAWQTPARRDENGKLVPVE